jgi:DoxX-like family
MFTAYIVVSIFTAAANSYAAIVDFHRPEWVVDNITRWGGSQAWLFPLGALKAGGALGLIIGICVPPIGVAAAIGLVLFFLGAIAVVIRARWYSHLPWPSTYLLLAVDHWRCDLPCRESLEQRYVALWDGGKIFGKCRNVSLPNVIVERARSFASR